MKRARMGKTVLMLLAAVLLPGSLLAWLSVTGDTSGSAERVGLRQAMRERLASARADRAAVVPVARAGQWRSEQRGRTTQPWSVQLQHNTTDGSLTGELRVVGSRRLARGIIRGHSDGGAVSGVVTDDAGSQLASFSGTIARDGTMSGTYTTDDGDSGTWTAPAAGG